MKKKRNNSYGRAKGKGFEREVSAQIIRAFKKYGICAKDCFRTPMSGAHRQFSEEDPGDLLISPKLREMFPFVVECKRDESFRIETFMQDPPKKDSGHGAWSFLNQAIRQAKNQGRPAMLICRKNHCEPIVVIPESYHPCYSRDSVKSPNSGMRFNYGQGIEWLILPWHDFLKDWVRFTSWKYVQQKVA